MKVLTGLILLLLNTWSWQNVSQKNLPFSIDGKSEDNFVLVRGSTFNMGRPDTEAERVYDQAQHAVTLTDFYISPYEVTQKQWKQVMGNNPSALSPDCDDCPVEKVSWDDVQDFLKKINTLLPGRGYRLPTEAEWEYAARGGNQSKGYLYAGSNNIAEVGWYRDNSMAWYKEAFHSTQHVGKLKANELDLYDMSGNVSEWCSDWYDEKYYHNSPAKNPAGPASGKYHVNRGGNWDDLAGTCRVDVRWPNTPDYFNYYLGFRLARSL